MEIALIALTVLSRYHRDVFVGQKVEEMKFHLGTLGSVNLWALINLPNRSVQLETS